jgi:hypothetical protein
VLGVICPVSGGSIKPNQTKSNQIKPNQTKSNQIKPHPPHQRKEQEGKMENGPA